MKRVVITAGLLLLLAAAIIFWLPGKNPPFVALQHASPATTSITNRGGGIPLTNAVSSAPPQSMLAANAPRLPVPQFVWFRNRPFAVTKTNGGFSWTAEDGKDTNIIRQLAHNELEYQRMVSENKTIFRRQLVYHSEGFTLLAQQAVQSGQSIQQIMVPGLDGKAWSVAVSKTDLESGGDRGLLYGKLPDDPDSMVTVAFINDREAFTVVSRQNKFVLQGEAREPGEIVVKSIDPATYGGPGD